MQVIFLICVFIIFEKRGLCMNNIGNRNSFRKIVSVQNTETPAENLSKFRKSIDARLTAPIKELPKMDRIPGHDVLFFE